MGPRVSEPKLDRGAYFGPMGITSLKDVPLYIPDEFPYLSPCGTNLFLRFRRTCGAEWRIGSITSSDEC